MNSQTIQELENSQNSVIAKWKATLLEGITKGYVNTEDSTQKTSILGKFDKQNALEFAQELSNAMDINILVNSIESWYANDEAIVHLIYDITLTKTNYNSPVIANDKLDARYGVKVSPQASQKLKM